LNGEIISFSTCSHLFTGRRASPLHYTAERRNEGAVGQIANLPYKRASKNLIPFAEILVANNN
jgi:hypothetical protein